MYNNLEYNITGRWGSDHAPVFKVSVEVAGQMYIGVGTSIKAARYEAATNALKSVDRINTVKNPVMILNELYPFAEYKLENNENDSYARFKYTIKIQDDIFSGSGEYILMQIRGLILFDFE